MAQVTGLGGVFVRSGDPGRLKRWYAERLGVQVLDFGARFTWREAHRPDEFGCSVWGVFAEPADYFAPSTRPFMVNLRVDGLDALLASLRAAGERVDERVEEGEFGRFGWVMDPDGTRVELWEPPSNPDPVPHTDVAQAVLGFLAAVDAGEPDALARCFDVEATVYFPFDDTPELVEGRAAVLERFARLFAAWKRRGRVPPYQGFVATSLVVRAAGPGHALATFVVGIEGAVGRRSVLARQTRDGWRILHLHASNLKPRATGS